MSSDAGHSGRARIGRQPTARSAQPQARLDERDAIKQQEHFGVSRAQVEHDFIISRILATIAPLAEHFIFYGGTALSRTFLDGLRLSEDIDLLSIGPRSRVAAALDDAIRSGLERDFGQVHAEPWLAEAKADTTASIYEVGTIRVRIQLIDGRDYATWPTQTSKLSQRYPGLPEIELTTFTPAGFIGAKTEAWCDPSRNAPRDLYDLWALARGGYMDAMAALVYKKHGATGGYPRAWAFPKRPPSDRDWTDALGHQCIPQVGPDEAFDQVSHAWLQAVTEARALGG